MDEDLLENEEIGKETYKIDDMLKNPPNFQILFKGKKIGELVMTSELVPIPPSINKKDTININKKNYKSSNQNGIEMDLIE